MAAGLGADSLAAKFKVGDGLEGYLGHWLLLQVAGGDVEAEDNLPILGSTSPGGVSAWCYALAIGRIFYYVYPLIFHTPTDLPLHAGTEDLLLLVDVYYLVWLAGGKP